MGVKPRSSLLTIHVCRVLPAYLKVRPDEDEEDFLIQPARTAVGAGDSCHREEVRLPSKVGRHYRPHTSPQLRKEPG